MDKTKIAVNVFNKHAEAYQQKFMDVSLYHNSLNEFCELLQKDSEVLELACGPGNITKYLLDKRPDLKITGTDLAPNMINLAKANNPSANFLTIDCREIKKVEQKFNAIMCGFCLPYLSKQESIQLINDCFELLLPAGVLYISTMEDDYLKSGFKKSSAGDDIYMHYHEYEYLKDAICKSGFKLQHVHRQNFPTNDGTKVTDLILIAQL